MHFKIRKSETPLQHREMTTVSFLVLSLNDNAVNSGSRGESTRQRLKQIISAFTANDVHFENSQLLHRYSPEIAQAPCVLLRRRRSKPSTPATI
jgi:hypothetical protein